MSFIHPKPGEFVNRDGSIKLRGYVRWWLIWPYRVWLAYKMRRSVRLIEQIALELERRANP